MGPSNRNGRSGKIAGPPEQRARGGADQQADRHLIVTRFAWKFSSGIGSQKIWFCFR